VLVTHGISFLPKMDMIITLVDGKVGEVGSFKELIGHNGDFAEFLKTYMIEELTCGDAEEEKEGLFRVDIYQIDIINEGKIEIGAFMAVIVW